MEGQDFSVFGIVEGKDDLVIIDEHRVQEDKEYEDDPDNPVIRRILAVHQEDLEVAEMYPDVKAWKEAQIHVYKSPQDA